MPGLPRQLDTIPLVRGLDGSTSRYLRPPDKLEKAINVRAPQTGGLGTRYGFTSQSALIAGSAATIGDAGPIRALGGTATELLAVAHRNLYAWVPPLNRWVDRGHVSPCVGSWRAIFRSFPRYVAADLAVTGSYVIYAGLRREDRFDGPVEYGIEWRGATIDGDSTFQPVTILTSTTSSHVWGPRAAKTSAGAVILVGDGVLSSGGTLRRYEYRLSTPYLDPFGLANLTSTVWIGPTPPSYDIISMADGGYLVAWIDSVTRDLELQRFNAAHASQAAATITGDFDSGVALADGAGDNIYLVTMETGDTGALVAYARVRSSLAGVWGPVTLYTKNATTVVSEMGLAEGNDGSSTRVAYSWHARDGATSTSEHHTRSSDTSGGTLDSDLTTHNAESATRPFWYRNRCYQHMLNRPTNVGGAGGFISHMLVDLGYGTTRVVRLAAIHGFGEATPQLFQLGVASHVALNGTTQHRYMASYIAERVKAQADSRDTQDEVTLDFDAPVTIAEGPRGSAVIGGGYIAWYDGVKTFELGFTQPPFMTTPVGTGSGTQPLAGTYTYSAVWEFLDSLGVLHRSVPGPGVAFVNSIDQNVNLAPLSIPASRHGLDMTCQVFRAGADAVPRRLNASTIIYPNTASRVLQTVTDSFSDASLVVPRYDVGGVLEAATPEGAQILHLARERLWAGRFYAPERVQFSKLVVPGASGEKAIAPEFFEAFARLMERGERVTGITSLDATIVILTDRSIYLIGGFGPDARGLGDDMSRLTRVASDARCTNFRSVVGYPDGILYQSTRGIYQLDRKHQVTFIGDAARDLTAAYPVLTSAVLVPAEQQVRWTALAAEGSANGIIIVFDYRIGEWFEWRPLQAAATAIAAVGATYVDNTYYMIDEDGVSWKEDTTTHLDAGTVFVPVTIETGEVQPPGPQAHWRLGKITVLAERRTAHKLKLSLARNYTATPTLEAEFSNTQLLALADPTSRMQVRRRPAHQRCQSQRIRLETAEDGTLGTGEGAIFHALTLELGIYGGSARIEEQGKS